jgi:Protein of unknown function (DUF2917)
MIININTNQSITLLPGQLASIVVGASVTLCIEAGLVWLTIEGDETDYWLRAGDTLLLPAVRHIVVESEKIHSQIVFSVAVHEEKSTLSKQLDHDAVAA